MEERKFEVVKEWKHKGKKCVIVLVKWNLPKEITTLHDSYNGYVETTLNQPYDVVDVRVHGGLTFGFGNIISVNIKGKFYGFDTGHYNDKGITHRDINYMTKECERLAEQLIKIEEGK